MHKRGFLILPLVAILLVLSGCGQTAADPSKLQVVATHSVVADLVRQTGGDLIQLRVLVEAGQDAHTYAPRPSDGLALTRADLVFESGLGFEPWLDGLFAATGTSAVRVTLSDAITPLTPSPSPESRPDSAEPDPHVWQDAGNAMRMVSRIQDALIALDPHSVEEYRRRAAAYLAELRTLDDWVRAQVAPVPPERRLLVTPHDTFRYFARAYGFQVLGSVLGSQSTETANPSAARIAGLVDRIVQAGVPAIFADNVSNPALLERIAAEARVRVAPALYTDALGPAGSAGDSYVKMIRFNVSTIVTALSD